MLNFLDSNSILFEKCDDCILCMQVDKMLTLFRKPYNYFRVNCCISVHFHNYCTSH